MHSPHGAGWLLRRPATAALVARLVGFLVVGLSFTAPPGLLVTAAESPGDAPSASEAPADDAETPSLPAVPPDARPPGEREPLIGALAAASIVVAAVAGMYVYRVIRKGL